MQGYTSLKILFHVSRYWPAIAGAALHTREMIHYLEKQHEISVIRHFSTEETTNEIAFANSNSTKLRDNKTTIYQLGAEQKWQGLLKFLSNYHQQLRIVRPFYSYCARQTLQSPFIKIACSHQVIHSVYTGLTPSVITAQNTAKKLNIPFILTPLPHIKDWDKPLAKSLLQLYQRADALIAMTKFEKDWLIDQGINAKSIHVCPIGALITETDSFNFRQKHELQDKPIVLFIGRQVAYKGYQQICQATRAVWQVQPNAHFIFIGPETKESQVFFSQCNDPRLINLGKVSLEEKCSALSDCNVLCVPSTEESLGAIYLEAWSYKKPVIAADIPAIHSVVNNRQDGLIVPQKSDNIAQALLQLLNNPLMAEKMAEQGYTKLQHQYNWEILAQRLTGIYKSLIQDKAKES